MKTKTVRNLLIFTFIAIASGWAGVLIDKLMPGQPPGDTLGMGLWLVLPLLAVVILRSFAGDGWKDAGLRPNLKSSAPWYLISFIIFPLVTGVVLFTGYLLGWVNFSNFDPSAFAGVFFDLLLLNFIKNIFEESVWRGYLTSKLIKLNLGDVALYLLVGTIWSLWHMPYYLEFLPGESMAAVLPVSRVTFFLVASLTMLFWTVMFVEIFRLTKSIWPVVLLHAVEDALINPLVIDGYIQIAQHKQIFISPICGILPASLYLLIGIWLRRKRKVSGNTWPSVEARKDFGTPYPSTKSLL